MIIANEWEELWSPHHDRKFDIRGSPGDDTCFVHTGYAWAIIKP
jgi:hypothetical protein